jgi:predicted nicotinamide N-methyase
VAAVRLNAAANDVRVSTFLGDPTGGPTPTVDVVLVGDLFYEESLAERVTAFLDRCLQSGVEALIGDPQRAFLPRSRLRLLAEHPGPDFGDGANDGSRRNAVFSFEAEPRLLPSNRSTTAGHRFLPRPPFP